MRIFHAAILILAALLVACTNEPAPPPPQAGNDAAPQAVATTVPPTEPTEEAPTAAATRSLPSPTATPEPTPAATSEPTPTPEPAPTATSAAPTATTPPTATPAAVSPTPTPTSTAVPEPTPTRLREDIDGGTWILESVDGQPLIDGTYATLTIDGPQFGGFDGCNSFGGRHETGKPVVKPDGTISVPPFGGTAVGCPTAILEQADRFLNAMTQQATARVVNGRLHIIDGFGAVVLVFFKQTPLIRHPIELAGTAWQLVDHDGMYGDSPTTVVFLDDRSAVGITACRDYQIGYSASNGRIRIPYTGMAGPTELCTRDALRKEHRYVEDFGWANEYAVDPAGGLRHMTVRTSRGKTLTFEPLPQEPDRILDGQWRLIRFFEAGSGGLGMRRLADTDVDPNADITAAFGESTIEGGLACHWYAYRAAGGGRRTLVGADGSMSMGEATLSIENRCKKQAHMSSQQHRYLDYLGTAERYHVFLDRLVIVTNSGDALMFQSNAETPETTANRDFFGRLSPQERECLGPEITSSPDVFAMLPTSPTTGAQMIRCLSKENQFQLYMSNPDVDDKLNEATHRCIWNSMAQLLDLDDPHAGPPTDPDVMGQRMTMMVAMPLYCAAKHQPDLESEELGFDVEETNYIVCAIDAVGGRKAWIKMLRESGPSFEVFIQAEDTCGQPTPQP